MSKLELSDEIAHEIEIESTFDQAVEDFLSQEDLHDFNADDGYELIFGDDELVRQFACYLISQLNEFIYGRGKVNNLDHQDPH